MWTMVEEREEPESLPSVGANRHGKAIVLVTHGLFLDILVKAMLGVGNRGPSNPQNKIFEPVLVLHENTGITIMELKRGATSFADASSSESDLDSPTKKKNSEQF
eukprot:Platyproteum_vivax@DN8309_c0_g1_i1.p2